MEVDGWGTPPPSELSPYLLFKVDCRRTGQVAVIVGLLHGTRGIVRAQHTVQVVTALSDVEGVYGLE